MTNTHTHIKNYTVNKQKQRTVEKHSTDGKRKMKRVTKQRRERQCMTGHEKKASERDSLMR